MQTSELLKTIVRYGVIPDRSDGVTFALQRSGNEGDELEVLCAELDRRLPIPEVPPALHGRGGK